MDIECDEDLQKIYIEHLLASIDSALCSSFPPTNLLWGCNPASRASEKRVGFMGRQDRSIVV